MSFSIKVSLLLLKYDSWVLFPPLITGNLTAWGPEIPKYFRNDSNYRKILPRGDLMEAAEGRTAHDNGWNGANGMASNTLKPCV